MICPIRTNRGAEILWDYCARTLEPARATEFEAHMEGCADCRRAVNAQSDLWETLDLWTPAPVSADFDARLYARIAREEAAPGWMKWVRSIFSPAVPVSIWKPVVPLAAACAVLAVGFLVHTPNLAETAKTVRADKVDIEQVEKTLEDLDMLTPVPQAPARSM
jgi:anti-sigma factor RsiW